ncbi:MAG: TetR/AcrR family transcriptional regulator [Cellvibrionaceae bacterium]|nr:TetR/AcrR family transcriptional regulator [Cellvibrionaceae bacterium]
MAGNIGKLGRPREFDIDDALSKAVMLFWEKGYDGTSIRDLSLALGVSGPSLYSVFGDKEGLYVRAIEHYLSGDSCAPLVAFDQEVDIKLAVRAFMEAALVYSAENPGGNQGCFMSNCVSANTATIPGAKELLMEGILSADLSLSKRFDYEKRAGNLPSSFPSIERAKLMFDLRQGYALRARAGISYAELSQDLDSRVEAILGLSS